MTTIYHRALRNEIRNLDGYRALSDAIKAEIEAVAPKSLDTEAAKQAMLGLSGLDSAYLGWMRAKREAVRTALWTEAARIITGDQTGLLYGNSAVYGAALAMSENPVAALRAQKLLNPYSVDADESDEDEADADEADADADADAEEIDA